MTLTAACILVALAAVATMASAHANHQAGLADESLLEVRGPILIDGDGAFTAANGVRNGTGTPSDPFMIKDWQIEGSSGDGIVIKNTTLAFRVINVRIDADRGADGIRDGVALYGISGDTMVEHVDIAGVHRYGVFISQSEAARVCDAKLTGSHYIGIYAESSTSMVWRGNIASGNTKHGFYLANGSSFNRLTQNLAFNNLGHGSFSFGFYTGIGSNDNRFDNNTAFGNGAGIQVNLAERNVFFDNYAHTNVDRGLSITQAIEGEAARNTLIDNGRIGLLLAQADEIYVHDNTIEEQGEHGIQINLGFDNTITRNIVRNSPIGIGTLNGSTRNLVYDNLFSNVVNAADPIGGNLWNVTKRAGPNVVGGDFIAGNYWSDITDDYHDHDGDGLAESHGPYNVGIVNGGDWLPIKSAPGSPTAIFSVSTSEPMSGHPVTFVDASIPGTSAIVAWAWDFGDGSQATGQEVVHAYAENGDYYVLLRVTDASGLTDTVTGEIRVQNIRPVAALTHPDPVVTNDPTVAFDATPSSDADGFIVAFEWTFGDGGTASGQQVTHVYGPDDRYTGRLLVVDNRQGSAALPFLVTLDRAAPATAAAVTGPFGHGGWYRGTPVVTLTASDALSGVAASEWRLGDGADWTPYTGPFALPDGVHTVQYRSHDVAGNAEAVRSVLVRVDAQAPESALAPASGFVGPFDTFTVTATDALSGANRGYYAVANGDWSIYRNPFTVAVADGPFTVGHYAEDVAGNAEPYRAASFIFDGTAPTITLATPSDRSLSALGVTVDATAPQLAGLPNVRVFVDQAEFTVTADDAGAGTARLEAFVDGAPVAAADGSRLDVTWRAPDYAHGAHVLTVVATDAVGNDASRDYPFTIVDFPGSDAPARNAVATAVGAAGSAIAAAVAALADVTGLLLP